MRDVFSHRFIEDIRAPHVICVGVTVHKMCDGLMSNAVDSRLELVAQCRRAIDYDDAVSADEENGLVGAVGDKISAIAEMLEIVADLGRDREARG